MRIDELFDSKVEFRVRENGLREYILEGEINGRLIKFSAMTRSRYHDTPEWDIDFSEQAIDPIKGPKPRYDLTGSGKPLQVFAMIKDALLKFINDKEPGMFMFEADKGSNDVDSYFSRGSPKSRNRVRVYEKMIEKLSLPDFKLKKVSRGSYVEFYMILDGYKPKTISDSD